MVANTSSGILKMTAQQASSSSSPFPYLICLCRTSLQGSVNRDSLAMTSFVPVDIPFSFFAAKTKCREMLYWASTV
jgi:hypothetical protein